jgi:hypothetical protein
VTYEEVMDAWRRSCPKLPVWEDANNRKFVAKEHRNGRCVISVTVVGSGFMEQCNRRAKKCRKSSTLDRSRVGEGERQVGAR